MAIGDGRTQSERLMELARAVVRPALTVLTLGIALVLVYQGRDVPAWLLTQAGMMTAWWFADRTKRE